MNDTYHINNKVVNPSDESINKDKRLDPEVLDERYIRAYLTHPEDGKTAALTLAGHPNPNPRRAWQIHKRLSDRIDRHLDELILEGAALGRSVLVYLAKHSDSDAVKASSASKLMDYAGKQRPDRLIVENRSIEEIDAEIAVIQKRILEEQEIDIPDSELH